MDLAELARTRKRVREYEVLPLENTKSVQKKVKVIGDGDKIASTPESQQICKSPSVGDSVGIMTYVEF
ncbi:hypothetical protein LIER_35803 [Lithospermum erythrorhizon]|uniref:Uncharacterized protein n=1 Tax=Lithospermum erythrorhizon TaxID=34254 RepID=A0AAV3NWH1_LITER